MKTLEEGLAEFYAVPEPDPQICGSGNRPWSRPLKSVALAVLPDQVPGMIADTKAKGVATEFTPDGRPVFTSRKHRADYMKTYGYFDRDGGYGDAAPRQHKGKMAPPSRIQELARKYAHLVRVRRENRIE